MAKFHFPLQPALDKAVADRKQCEIELVDLQNRLSEQQSLLLTLENKLAETVQRIDSEHDNLSAAMGSPSHSEELARRNRFIDSLQNRADRERNEVREQANRVSLLEVQLDEKRQELSERIGAVKALENLKEQKHQAFKQEQTKREERQRDDDAIQQWNRNNK